MFLSDVTCALDYEIAEDLLDLIDVEKPDEDEEPFPAGRLDILADLGVSQMEISALCDDAELFPDEQIEAIASRLGFGEEFAELLEL